ncbi:MAG: sugar transferase [Armatimonadota bacterium]
MSTRAERHHSMVEKMGGRMVKPSAKSTGMHGWNLAIKRAIDALACIIVAPFVVPIWAVIAIAIRLDSAGPTVFKQTRIGKGGKPFTLYKFRSMVKDAEKVRADLECLNEATGPIFKIKKDPRVTRVGAFMRRTSLDEIPQILNVLKGDMSLVGPRPPLPCEVEKYTDYQRGRLAVQPGITCLWQIQGRSSLTFEQWVELDLEYICNQSLWLDMKILLKTIPAVLRGSGAW